MLLAPYNQSHSLAVDLPARADATPTFAVYNPGGASLLTGSVTLDSVNTTLSGAASAGATTLSVTSASGVEAGRVYLAEGAEWLGGESVTVKSISATTLTLARPVLRAKASGATFASTRVTIALTAAASAVIDRHYRVEIAWSLSSVAQPPWVVDYDVVRYWPYSNLRLADLLDLDPLLQKRLPAGLWLPALVAQAWTMLLRRIAQKHAPGALVGSIDLTIAHGYQVRALLAETAGSDWVSYRDDMRKQLDYHFQAAMTAHAFDDNQDGAIASNEGFRPRTFEILRG